ncbi:MAG: DEAD/DEAH box helicase family protein [Culicoidibacterales bacterium]
MQKNKWCVVQDGERGIAAVLLVAGKWYCQRCGNNDQTRFYQYFCESCQADCWYCRDCVSFGMMTTCQEIYVNQEKFSMPAVTYQWSGVLSEQQQHASERVQQLFQQRINSMVYAVCGAGKTEMMFETIYDALQHNCRVCWATPRADVVKELKPRLQQAFQGIEIVAHYQNSPDSHRDSPLVVATTNQLIRYYEAFDWIIIDEVDAFPYTIDEKLKRFVQRALSPNGSITYLTATPSIRLQKEFDSQTLIQLPARYHRRPLPVPSIKLLGTSKSIFSFP